ncbi:MAG: HEAT repeat domain-containing protein [Acidobacteriota bacterium]
MSDTSALDDTQGSGQAPEPSHLRVALGFFILPLMLVVGAVGVFLLFGLIAHEDKPASEYLTEVTGGGINEPWQAAFHLAQKLARDDSLHGDATLARSIAQTLEHKNARNPKVREFLVLALGSVGHPSSVPVLSGCLDDEDADVRLKTLLALGSIGPPSATPAAPAIAELLADEDVGVRTYAAYLLGMLENQTVRAPLAVALNDPAFQVRGNAAVALARLGDAGGLPELHKMLDRDYLASNPDLNPQQQRDAMVAAIQALGLLGSVEARSKLESLESNDPDLRVREAARAVLTVLQRAARP